MAVKPSLDPKWSTSNNPLDNIEPAESLKIGGVPAGGVWGREFLNWQFYAISQWIDWVRSSALDRDNNLSDLTNAATARTNLGLNNTSVTLGANIATADKLKTARTISLSGDLTGNVMFDGSANVALFAQVGNDSHTHSAATITAATTSVAGVTQLNNSVTSNLTTQAATANAARLAYNRAAEYAPSKTGTGASGSWGISVTGNAATATQLATARTIGGVSFDGTANVNLPGVNIAGNQNTSGNAATATVAASCSGNAASADKWSTARTITLGGDLSGSVSIDGSANVTLSAQVNDNSHNHAGLSGSVSFTGSTGNDYNNSNIMVNGNGTANTIKPSIGFHQSGLYAGTLSQLDGNTFQFKNQSGGAATLNNNITGSAGYAATANYATSAGSASNATYAASAPPLTSYPIGATYIQFPGRDSPSTLFGGTWSQIFNTEGVFFRTEGGNASAFGGGVQGGAIQSHGHSASTGAAGSHYHLTGTSVEGSSADYGERARYGLEQIGAGRRATGGAGDGSPRYSPKTNASGSHAHTVTVNSSGGVETRPINRTIRVWVRTA